MQRNDFESTVALYESGYDSIESVLDDDALSAREKLDAIEDIVYGTDDESDDEQAGD